eukprot:363947-Chlamydomonas_euryale.AAC.1
MARRRSSRRRTFSSRLAPTPGSSHWRARRGGTRLYEWWRAGRTTACHGARQARGKRGGVYT